MCVCERERRVEDRVAKDFGSLVLFVIELLMGDYIVRILPRDTAMYRSKSVKPRRMIRGVQVEQTWRKLLSLHLISNPP